MPKNNELPITVMVIFEDVTERIERDGLVMNDKSIILEVTRTEYEMIEAFWIEFKNYVRYTTGKWNPLIKKCVNWDDGYGCYIHFYPSQLAKACKAFSKMLDNKPKKVLA